MLDLTDLSVCDGNQNRMRAIGSESYGKYCALFQCAKGPQDIGLVKRQSFSLQ